MVVWGRLLCLFALYLLFPGFCSMRGFGRMHETGSWLGVRIALAVVCLILGLVLMWLGRAKAPAQPPPPAAHQYSPSPIPSAREQLIQLVRWSCALLIFSLTCMVPAVLFSAGNGHGAEAQLTSFALTVALVPITGLIGFLFAWIFMAATRPEKDRP